MPEDEKEPVNLPEEEEEEEVAEVAAGGFFQKIKAHLIKILAFTAAAALIILISVFVSTWVSKKVHKEGIREIGGKIVIPPPPPVEISDMGEFTINIKGDDEEPHFIRVHIVLGYGRAGDRSSTQVGSEISTRRSQIQHIINMILGGKSKQELDTPEGKRNLSIEIRDQINQVMSSGSIKQVYFKSITVM
ncbi:MAG: flagellar basal body-associated FliL family protein [Spirochaetes bacterium]|nr:flagellar basal body-associated FliL family protein [Spirochaetota bacterium]